MFEEIIIIMCLGYCLFKMAIIGNEIETKDFLLMNWVILIAYMIIGLMSMIYLLDGIVLK